MADKSETPPAPETIRIRFLQATACETVEGQTIDVKKDDLLTVPKRAAEYLIANKRAVAEPE